MKTDCTCQNTQLVKKGFSGFNAGLGFIISVGISLCICYFTLDSEKHTISLITDTKSDDLISNSILLVFCGILPILGLLGGTISMNSLLRVCTDCLKTKRFDIISANGIIAFKEFEKPEEQNN